MFVNVGGFGHTGNTALMDFLIDTGQFSPFAKDFGETAVLRGKWGVGTLFKMAVSEESAINAGCFYDAMLGYENGNHNLDDAPNINDFKRNARIRLQWGNYYISAVESLAEDYVRFTNGVYSKGEFLESIKNFFSTIKKLSGTAAPHLLTRNDPAAYSPKLLELGLVDLAIFIYRDPLDVFYEWSEFYHGARGMDVVQKFALQFNKKVDRFFNELSGLSEGDRSRFLLIRFEDLVQDPNCRKRILEFLKIDSSCNSLKDGEVKFSPKASAKNIGVGERFLDPEVAGAVREKTSRAFAKLRGV